MSTFNPTQSAKVILAALKAKVAASTESNLSPDVTATVTCTFESIMGVKKDALAAMGLAPKSQVSTESLSGRYDTVADKASTLAVIDKLMTSL